jgi:molybdate transport system substrate-binding protein
VIALLVAAELVVFAASSLREAFQQLGNSFEQGQPGAHVALNLAGSQDLRVQIENGAAADVFASADLRQMQALAKLAVAPKIFARNLPVLVVPAGNPAGLRSFADLPKARRIVLGAAEVPIGAYTERILEAAGPEFRRRVEKRVVSRELNVRQVLAMVSLGEADAAVVYRTDAQAAAGKVQMLEIPGAPVAEYPIAPLAGAPHPDLARRFVELVLSPAGQRVLESFGFLRAP